MQIQQILPVKNEAFFDDEQRWFRRINMGVLAAKEIKCHTDQIFFLGILHNHAA